jgi:hypothetical protein
VLVGAKRDVAWPYFGFADAAGDIPARLPYRDDDARCGLPGRVRITRPGGGYQPDEPPFQLTTEHLKQVQATLKARDLQPGRYVLPQMIITPAG